VRKGQKDAEGHKTIGWWERGKVNQKKKLEKNGVLPGNMKGEGGTNCKEGKKRPDPVIGHVRRNNTKGAGSIRGFTPTHGSLGARVWGRISEGAKKKSFWC